MAGWIAVVSTAYCLGGTMADGTPVRAGSVANNFLPLGTRVTVTASPTQRRRFVVRDRIGWGTQLDFWTPSCTRARAWGRRTVRLHVGWPHKIGRARPGRGRIYHKEPPCPFRLARTSTGSACSR